MVRFVVPVAILLAALVAPAVAVDVPGTDREDLLTDTRYPWRVIGEDGTVVDLEAVAVDARLPEIALRVDASLGALEAVLALRHNEAIEPVFLLAVLPLVVVFSPPLPLGDGLETLEPLRLSRSAIEVRSDEANGTVTMTSSAEIPFPANGTSPPPSGSMTASGAQFAWRTEVVASAHDDALSGTRSPALARTTYSLILPATVEGPHEVTWNVLMQSRTQNQGALHPAAGDDAFLGVYAERGGHRGAFRLLTEDPGRDTARSWRVLDFVHGPLPAGERTLLPMQLLATTTMPLASAASGPGDAVTLELGFYSHEQAAAGPPGGGGPGMGVHPRAPSWMSVLIPILLLFLLLDRGRRWEGATKE